MHLQSSALNQPELGATINPKRIATDVVNLRPEELSRKSIKYTPGQRLPQLFKSENKKNQNSI